MAATEPAVALPARFDLTTVGEVHARLRSELAPGRLLVLDGTEVEEVDSAAIQLLCAVSATAVRRSAIVTWTAVSPTLVSLAKLLGVFELLGLADCPQRGLEWFE